MLFIESEVPMCTIGVAYLLCLVQLFSTSKTTAYQASLSFTLSQSLLKFMFVESVMWSNHLILCLPLLHLPSIFSTPGSLLVSGLFASGGQGIGAFLQDSLVWCPCSPRVSCESSQTLQFKSINSSVLKLLHGPTLTSIMTTGKKTQLWLCGLCQLSNVSAFE